MAYEEITIQKNVKIGPHTSWRVGGVADHYCLPETIDQLRGALTWARDSGHSVVLLGGGTNVLVSDGGIRGLLIHLKKLNQILVSEVDRGGKPHLVIESMCGVSKSEILKQFLKYELPPALFLAGLPGDVGGGVVMNAGVGESVIPREFGEIVDWIEVLTENTIVRYSHDQLKWSYRHCEGWGGGVITRVGMSWPLERNKAIREQVKAANQLRLQKQPLELPSCGSVFINPPGQKAGQLIESCGLKGFRIGGAMVSGKHANFISNVGDGTACDIHGVVSHVQQVVREQTGVELKTEVVYIGEWALS